MNTSKTALPGLLCLILMTCFNASFSKNGPALKPTSSNKLIGNFSPTTGEEKLSINLYAYNSDGTISLNDGSTTNYDNFYSNAVDYWDALKIPNFAENIAVVRENTDLAIERRKIIPSSDTAFIKISQMLQKTYKFEIMTQNLNHPNLHGYLYDDYTRINKTIDLNGTTNVDFTVNTDPASYAPDRFKIIYYTPNSVTPLEFTGVKAYRHNNDITVNWTVENETSMRQYEVEHATDGRHFSSFATMQPAGNNSAIYNIQDTHPFNGDNFYRVKGISLSGLIQYSVVVKVGKEKPGSQISIFPNPVNGNNITLLSSNQPAGIYKVHIFNNSGQMIYNKTIELNGSYSTQSLQLPQKPAPGIYQLALIGNDQKTMNMKLVVQ